MSRCRADMAMVEHLPVLDYLIQLTQDQSPHTAQAGTAADLSLGPAATAAEGSERGQLKVNS